MNDQDDRLTSVRHARRNGEKWRVYPDDVIPAWIADMDYPIAESIRSALQEVIARSDLGYPLDPRKTHLPELVAERMRTRCGWSVDPSRIEFVADVMQGISIAIDRLSAPGDGVLVQVPVYPPLLACAPQLDRTLRAVPLMDTQSGYVVDVDAFARAIDSRTRLLILCNPQNPTGRVFSRTELEAIGELALRHDLIILSDEIHQDLVYDGARHIPIASLSPEIEARTITFTSASKAFNIAGTGCAVALFGSRALQQRFESYPVKLPGRISTLALEALRAAWESAESQVWLESLMQDLTKNRDELLRTIAGSLPAIRVHAPQATCMAWCDCRALNLGASPAKFFLKQAKVALMCGSRFGDEGIGYVRITFGTSPEILRQILERMSSALDQRK